MIGNISGHEPGRSARLRATQMSPYSNAYNRNIQYDGKANCGSQITGKTKAEPANSEPALNGRIYPNPTNGNFTLELESPLKSDGKLVVYSLDGREMVTFEMAAGENRREMQVLNLPQGMYLCRLFDGPESLWFRKITLIKK